jgi:membrane-associated protein
MTYARFFIYNVTGAAAWVVLFLAAGYLFGSTPAVQKHFHYIIVGIIIVSALPAVYEFIKAKTSGK